MALTNKLTAIGDAIRNKTGSTDLLTLDEMPTAINGIETGGGGGGDLPEEALQLTGNCQYKFAYGSWNWFIEQYGDKITTENVTGANNLFSDNETIENIPFDINLQTNTHSSITKMFYGCKKLRNVPYITGQLGMSEGLFYNCYLITEIPEDWGDKIDWSMVQNATSVSGSCGNWFQANYCLRKIPDSILKNKYNLCTSSSYGAYKNEFRSQYVLDELKGIPIQKATVTSNMFSSALDNLGRVKSITFRVQEDGTPYTVSWKTQTIDLSKAVGYVSSQASITNYTKYHGIGYDKYVGAEDKYQALKNDPDWWTDKYYYSRYNRLSAVETINSLPDTSEYLTANGGTNTIKFLGDGGFTTDGGSIRQMTEEEIAVATAKGWTVTLV